jgi:isoleucyl-tRNA synthetase
MTDYKDTLNLPHTDFPMKANLPQRELEILQQWRDNNMYKKIRAQGQGRKKFILPDGPPYANGHIHIGHAVNKILKDLVIKARTLSGFDAPLVPGWDCHGLPIELNVEKKFGKAGDKLTAKEFRAACRAYAAEQIAIQREEFMRLGVIGDWDHPYRTMDFAYEANVIRALAKIIVAGHVAPGFKPVHWCMDCASSLAEAEVEYQNKTSPAIDVRFRVIEEEKLFSCFAARFLAPEERGVVSIPIWTTTPWTLPANQAVALHPELEYVLVQIKTERGIECLALAQALLADCLARYGVTESRILGNCTGEKLAGLLLQHPFYERQAPVILGAHVTADAGTGAVHIAPAHGEDDYLLGVSHRLPLINPVGSNGCFLPNTLLFANQHVFKANPQVIAVLRESHALLCEQKLEHSYPHCWRHKTPLIFLATPQWFISMEKEQLRTKTLGAIEQTQWLPEWGKSRIMGMIADRPDWCISRQRTWGVPLALFIHKETRELHPQTPQLMEQVAALVEQTGIDAWHDLEAQTLLKQDAEHYEKINDVLDVWFDSGVSHFSVLQNNPALAWPADLYLEGSDQHRGWFQTSLLTACAIEGQAPYKAVLTHGFAVDEKGRKMSKSVGNVVAPEKVINSLGADILRLWVAATDYRSEIAVSDEILKRMAEAYRRIRNTTRFLLANLHDFDPIQHLVASENMLSLDRWVIERTAALQVDIEKAYDDYQFHVIYQKLHNFCITDLGGFYLDIIKDRQYTMQKNSLGRRSAQTALYYIAEAMVRWFAPILSFTAEEIWRYLPGERTESVFLNTWYKLPEIKKNAQAWDILMTVREAVNKEIEKYRNANEIGSALEAEVELYCEPDSALDKMLRALANELRFVLITSEAQVLPFAARGVDAITLAIMIENQNNSLAIKITPVAQTRQKCARCWHRRVDVGSEVNHPEICARCVENVAGAGEQRYYA